LWWSAASPAGSWRPPPSPSLPLDVCPLDPQPPHATTFFSFPPPRCAPGLGGQAVGGRGGDACDDLVERVLDGEAEHVEEAHLLAVEVRLRAAIPVPLPLQKYRHIKAILKMCFFVSLHYSVSHDMSKLNLLLCII